MLLETEGAGEEWEHMETWELLRRKMEKVNRNQRDAEEETWTMTEWVENVFSTKVGNSSELTEEAH